MNFIEVELPDGTILEFPEGTPEEEMRNAIRSFNPSFLEQAPQTQPEIPPVEVPAAPMPQEPATGMSMPVEDPVSVPEQGLGSPTTPPTAPAPQAEGVNYLDPSLFYVPNDEQQLPPAQSGGGQDQGTPRTGIDFLDDPNAPLPDFNTGLYAGQTREVRGQIFNRFANDPDTIGLPAWMYDQTASPLTRFALPPPMRRDSQGRLRFITRPGFGLPFGSGADITDLAGQSVPAAISNVAGFGASLLDRSGITEDAVGAVDRNIPRPAFGAGSGIDQIFVETVPMIASGTAVGSAVWNGLRNAPLAFRTLGTYVSSSVAVDTVAPVDAGGFVFGERSMADWFRIMDIEDPDRAEEIIQDRVNLLVDGLATGGITGKTVQLTALAAKLVYDSTIRRGANALFRLNDSVADRYADQILDTLMAATNPNATAQQREAMRSQLISLVEENAEVLQNGVRQISVPDINNPNATREIPLDTLGVLLRSLDPSDPVQGPMYVAAQELRRGYLNRAGMTQTRMAAQGPQTELNRQLEQYLDDVGGVTESARTATINRGSEGLAEQGRTQVREVADQVDSLRTEVADLREPTNFLASLDDNLELADTVERLSRATGTEISALRSDNLRQVEEQVRQGLETIRARKNDAYAAVSGGPIDVGSLFDTLMNANIDALTRSGTSLPLRQELRQIVNLLQPQWRNPQGQSVSRDMIPFNPDQPNDIPTGWRQESRDEVISRAQEWFSLSPEMYNYGFFHNRVRQELSALRSNLLSGPTQDVNGGRALSSIIDTIDNQMLNYVGRTDPSLVRQVEEARRIYQNDYAPFFRDGALSDYAQIYADTTAGSRVLQPVILEGRGLDLLQSTIQQTTEGAGARVAQIRGLLDRPEAGANSEALFDYLATDIMSDMITSIRAAGVQGVDPARLNQIIAQEGAKLNRSFPERAAMINDFIRSLEAAQGAITNREAALTAAEESLERIRDRVRNGELASFFSRTIDSSAPVDDVMSALQTNMDGYGAFTSLFRGNNAINDVNTVMSRIMKAPEGQREVLLDGVRTAYARMLQDPSSGGIITRSSLMADQSAASQARISAALQEQSNLFAIGRIIHRDTPEVMDALESLASTVSADLRVRSGSANPGQSPTAFNTEILRDADRSVRWAVGALSRVGTQIRTMVSTGLERLDITGVSLKVMDNIASNPEAFVRAHRRLQSNPTDPEIIDMYYRIVLRGLVVGSGDDPASDVVTGMINAELSSRREQDETERMLDEGSRTYPPLRIEVGRNDDIGDELRRALEGR